MEIAKLEFTSPLHLSRGKSTLDESFDVLHSDTLKSALFVCALQLYGDLEVQEDFFEKFTLSSAFPYVNDILFFPKPEQLKEGILDTIDRKKVKKIKYFAQNDFEKLLKGEVIILDENRINNTLYYTEIPILEKQPYQSETVQRVTVNRTFEEEGNTFYTERLYFTEGCGLFFLIEFHDENYRSIIEAALRLLGDNGIGSDKSVGNGQFEFKKFEHFSFNKAQVATKQVALSLYCPKKEEVQNEAFLSDSAYSLIKRGGYIANPDNFDKSTLRKKSIVMFTEGSVFPKAELEGKVVDLKPEKRPDVEHPIYRDGRAMFFPYNLK